MFQAVDGSMGMTPTRFVEELSSLRFPNSFNPYSDQCELHDRDRAAIMRFETLLGILEVAAADGVDSIWLGRDLGYRGGRRTGLAFTDDVRVRDHANRWGVTARRTTVGAVHTERTATVVWRVLSEIQEHTVFLWNVFPLHPHEPGNPFSNRFHNKREREAGIRLLGRLIALLAPRRLIAIGNDAARAVCSAPTDSEVEVVRHPSYGGQTVFASRMCELYGLDGIVLSRNQTAGSRVRGRIGDE